MMRKTLICPGCGSVNDGQSGINCEDRVPKARDVTVCAYCQTVAIVRGDGVTLRKARPGELPAAIQELLDRAIPILRAKGLKRTVVPN